MQTTSTIACPECGARKTEEMGLDACRYFYMCQACQVRFRPLQGDCCVFCSYGDVPCPPKQAGSECCSETPLPV